MAVVNVNSLLNGKDSRWLQLEVCREFQRNKCTRSDTECKFAHPPPNVEVQNGRVTACYDSIKGRCNRDKPPCKYFHPPQHLKDQLLINGRNHLALKNALLQQMGLTPGQPVVQSQVASVDAGGKLHQSAAAAAATALALGQPQLGLMTSPYLSGVPQVGNTFNPYFNAGPMLPTAALLGPDPNNPLLAAASVQQTVVGQQKLPRTDRLEASTAASVPQTQGLVTLADIAGRKRPHDSADDLLTMAFPGMVPFKRAAGDKSGVPVYQQNAASAAYQQLMQPFVPVSCEYRPTSLSSTFPSSAAAAFTGIALNKQSLGTNTFSGLTPTFQRYPTSLNSALAQHLLMRTPQLLPSSVNLTTPNHFSELLAAQFSSLANNVNNTVNNGTINPANNIIITHGNSHNNSNHNNNINNIINNNNNTSTNNNNNNDDDGQPYKKLKTT